MNSPILASENAPVVALVEGAPMADSRDVARLFEKEHRNVLRDIRGLLSSEHTPPKGWFSEAEYVEPGNGQTYPRFLMNRDGFSLLAMGFTGAKALGWKLAYIEAFNRMEASLRADAPARIDVRDPAQLALIAEQLVELNRELTVRAETAERAVAIAAPKAAFYDRFADTEGLYGLQNAARALGQPPQAFIDGLKRDCLFYQGGALVPRADFANRGLFHVKTVLIGERATYQTFVTARGLQWLAGRIRARDAPALPAPAAGDLFDSGVSA